MTRSLIAGLTALTLTLTPAAPVSAQTFDQEAFGKMLFGLIAALAVGKIVQDANEPVTVAAAQPPKPRNHLPRTIRHPSQPIPVHDRGGLQGYAPPVEKVAPSVLGAPRHQPRTEPPVVTRSQRGFFGNDGWQGQRPKPKAQSTRTTLPTACVKKFKTKGGHSRILVLRCLDKRSKISAKLPSVCFRQVQSGRSIKRGFNIECLRGAGYRFK